MTAASVDATRRGRPRRAETDEAVNAATRRLLAEVGYGDLTVEAVAKLAGVGKPTVYRRHGSKAELVAAALLDELRTANPTAPTSGDVAADARELLGNLATLLSTTDFGRAITEIVSPANREAHLADLFDTIVGQRRELIRSVMRRADEQHRLLATDVETAIDLALGAIYFRHLISHDSLDTAFVTAVVASVIAPKATRRR
ncbi:MAG: TetR/AcrR family transcriptional regulator [Acidimicrobiales bacterium]|nr:TetR/AcrR family transcriptional regulator [Acidimicrobiales bacterium]MCB9393300.1 TetR/AcrR family transcriptional regulator [Acidimicrobiaceae bacterium]